MKLRLPILAAVLIVPLAVLVPVAPAAAAVPPAPTLVAPAANASVLQPVSLSWTKPAISTSVVAYWWEVGTTSTFSSVVLAGNAIRGPGQADAPTQAKVSGLANGTYFWHVYTTADDPTVTGGMSTGPFSAPRSFTITGSVAGTLPAPTLTKPANLSRFHPYEREFNEWTAVPGVDHYLFEYDNEPSFSLPLFNADYSPIPADTTNYPIYFGQPVGNLWFRVRAVAADGTRSLPSNVRQATISFTAPIPPAPLLTGPPTGSTGTLPVTFDWADDAVPTSYEFQIGSDPNFVQANRAECTGVEWCVRGIPESQWTAPSLTTGTKYWRVRSEHGDISETEPALSAWSAVRSFTVQQTAPTIQHFSIDVMTDNGLTLKSHTNAPSGTTANNQVFGRLELDPFLPPAGTTVTLTSSDPSVASVPASVVVPRPASLDATAALASFPIDPKQVTTSKTVTITATLPTGSKSVTLTVDPPSVQLFWIGATTVSAGDLPGSVTLAGAAPAGGSTVTFTSSNPAIVPAPSALTIPAGGYTAPITAHINAVSASTPVTLTARLNGISTPIDLTVKPPPTLLAPANGATFAPGAAVRFDWTDEVIGSELQVSTSPSFATTVVYQFFYASSEYTTTSLPSGTLYWRVRGDDDGYRTGPWSSTGTLTVGAGGSTPTPTPPPTPTPTPTPTQAAPPTSLAAPALSAPASGTKVNQGKSVTFSWSAVSGAASYQLQLDNSSGFTVPLVLSQTTSGTQFSTSSLNKASLSWRVRAMDSAGNAGAWSTVRSLTIK